METEINLLKEKVRKLLAEFIGIETEDIKDEDFLDEDLHMTATDISDFIHSLENSAVDITKLDLENIETFEDLIDGLVENL